MICKMSESKCAFVYIYITYTTFVTRVVPSIKGGSQITLINEKRGYLDELCAFDPPTYSPSVQI